MTDQAIGHHRVCAPT